MLRKQKLPAHSSIFLISNRRPLRTPLITSPIRHRPKMSRSSRIIIRRPRHLTSQLLQRLPLRLGNQQGGEDAAQHEERKDLHHVVEPGRVGGAWGSAFLAEGAKDTLSDDGADFA